MIKQLESHYLEQQLAHAELAKQSRNLALALQHYQRAYHEARWLCDHFIDGECASHAEQALNYLKTASTGCIDCCDSASTHLSIEVDLETYQAKIRCTFGGRFSRALFAHSGASYAA